jgi:DNA-binding CsgD family transcriptional regulator
MRDWLETHYKSLDRHFIDLLALVSRRLNVDRDKAVLESERLVRTALYTRKARPAATLFDAWRKAAVLGFLPQGIGDDERVLGERLVHFCFRREKEVWEHLARLREDELARIDLLPELGESPAPSERPSPLSIQAKLPAKKRDLSQYLDSSGLTDRQHECASLYFEYNLPITEIARRLGITRKVVDEHIAAAKKKVDHSKLRDQRAANKARSGAF